MGTTIRLSVFVTVLAWGCAGSTAHAAPAPRAVPAKGPLRVHPTNPRYFTDETKRPDGSLNAVYLAGFQF